MAPCAAGSGTVSSARADGNGVGNSLSVAFAPMSGTCGAATTAAAIAAGTASGCGAPGQRVLIEQMVGDCCNCAFSISATGTVQVFASAGGYATLWGSFTAYAEAAGQVVFWSPCDSTASPGALASASASEAGSSMPNPDAKSVTMPVLACTDHACTSMVIVSTTVIVQTHATATHTYSSAVAEAGVNASSNHTVTGSAAPCLPDCD